MEKEYAWDTNLIFTGIADEDAAGFFNGLLDAVLEYAVSKGAQAGGGSRFREWSVAGDKAKALEDLAWAIRCEVVDELEEE